jgi:hypothetical protein
MAWLIGRTQTHGREDDAAAHAVQDRCKLTPMSAWGTSYVPQPFVPVPLGVDGETPPPVQVARMDAETFFGRLNALMKCNPPAAGDARAVERFAAIGVVPGAPVDCASLDPVVVEALEQCIPIAQAIIGAAARRLHGKGVKYRTDYLERAAAALTGLGTWAPAATEHEGEPWRR